MAAKTKIEWADSTLNFWIGCTKVSPACDHCYAESEWADRKHRVIWGPHGDRSPTKTHPAALKWQKAANDNGGVDPELGRRRRVFVNSLSDSFDNHGSIDRSGARQRMWDTIRSCPDVIFMLLTKRPQNILRMLPADWGAGWPNVWIGTTVENQKEANRRIGALLDVPAAVHFLSMEPLLGEVDLKRVTLSDGRNLNALTGRTLTNIGTAEKPMWRDDGLTHRWIQWVIGGGESGPHARPTRPEWATKVEQACHSYRTAFFFKQWGEWGPDDGPPAESADRVMEGRDRCAVWTGRNWSYYPDGYAVPKRHLHGTGQWLYRSGKKRTGRTLGETVWSEFPDERLAA